MTGERIEAITMPKWGMTMTEGKVAAWLAEAGEAVAKGREFVEIETEKIANGVEAERDFVLRRTLVAAGDSAPCGAPIAVAAAADVPEEEIDAFLADFRPVESGGDAGDGLSERMIETDGPALRVVTAAGPAPGPGAAPAILLHGFGADAMAWMFNHSELAARRPVHAIELPSHGGSGIDASLRDLDALAAPVRQAIDALADGPVHLVGHSLGGRIAARLAADMGERVASLTLIAPAGMGPVNDDFLTAFTGATRRRPMKAALRMLVADPSTITSEMIERTLSYKRLDGVDAALDALAALLRDLPPLAPDLEAATAPTLILWGAADAVLPPPGAGERRIEGAGHMPQMERASEVNALLLAHMDARA
jgi:pyruvate dehydrogenase E2 component (dihydrolipoamide acetyltransferase)